MDEVELKIIARGTPGFTGADLANLVNEAALLLAARNDKKAVDYGVTLKRLKTKL